MIETDNSHFKIWGSVCGRSGCWLEDSFYQQEYTGAHHAMIDTRNARLRIGRIEDVFAPQNDSSQRGVDIREPGQGECTNASSSPPSKEGDVGIGLHQARVILRCRL